MVVEFTTNCLISAYHSNAVSSNHANGEAYTIQLYKIKFVIDLQYGFLRFPPLIKLTATISLKHCIFIVESGVKHNNPNTLCACEFGSGKMVHTKCLYNIAYINRGKLTFFFMYSRCG